MIKEESDLLTQTGPATPCGELLRRYWQPAALSEELPRGGAPKPVRLLGEELVLFRDDQGRPGLLGLHCSHRGADLSYGRVEDGGLRCIYHGWLYDIHGRCLDQPGEPGGGEHKNSIRHPAYPCKERAGAIFTYMGRGEPPLLPDYDFLTAPENHVFAGKLFNDCNYLQGNEGNIDLLHTSFLHFVKRDLESLTGEDRKQVLERYGTPDRLSGRGPSPGLETTDAELLEYGLRFCKLRRMGPQENYIRVATFVLPNLTVIPGGEVNWHVPVDDTHHWKYIFFFNRDEPMAKEQPRRDRAGLAPPPEYKPIANKGNRYLQDRESMKGVNYSGIKQSFFAAQDLCAVEGAGPIQGRTREHMVASDLPIVLSRKLLIKAIRDLQEGREPKNIVRDAESNRFPDIVATFGVIPSSLGWKEHCKQLIEEGRAWQTRRRRGF